MLHFTDTLGSHVKCTVPTYFSYCNVLNSHVVALFLIAVYLLRRPAAVQYIKKICSNGVHHFLGRSDSDQTASRRAAADIYSSYHVPR